MIWLQTQNPQGPNLLSNLLLFGGILIIFYFFMIRPQQQKIKKEKEFRENLKKGDKIVTVGGLHGKIVQVDEKTVIVEVDNHVKLTFEKDAIKALASNS
jgi:preprotein translocase subunit YajC